MNFYWAIHPGLDIKWTNEDRDNLVNKLEKMYGLGIRSFAVFFDDISGEGSRAEKQAELLNYVDSAFVRKHGDVSPLLLCPTIYNRAWSGKGDVYLHTLGQHLRPGIEVMWTGNSVVHTIEKEGMNWINERIRRKGYIWFNFPVNDFVRDHLLLGPTYGNGLDIADDLSGFVSNPMQYAESSKIPSILSQTSVEYEALRRDEFLENAPSKTCFLRRVKRYRCLLLTTKIWALTDTDSVAMRVAI